VVSGAAGSVTPEARRLQAVLADAGDILDRLTTGIAQAGTDWSKIWTATTDAISGAVSTASKKIDAFYDRVQPGGETYLSRAQELQQRVTGTETPPEGAPLTGRGQVLAADRARRTRPPAAGSTISPSLRRRAESAAAAAGLDPGIVDQIVAQAATQIKANQTLESQGVPLEPGTPLTVEDFLQDQIVAWETAAGPIGVPAGYTVTRAERRPDSMFGEADPRAWVDQERGPRYFEGDQFNFSGLSPEDTEKLQKRLVDAGLMEPGEYWPGILTDVEYQAILSTMGMANNSGKTIDEVLFNMAANLPESIKEARRLRDAAKVFQADPFIKPDPAALNQSVKNGFRNELGRDPTRSELAEWAGRLGADAEAQYRQEVRAAEAKFNTAVAIEETGVAPSPGTFTEVDPVARFQEEFDKRYGPEIAFRESQPLVAENQANVFQSLATMGHLIG
jgi:hypothetical protein